MKDYYVQFELEREHVSSWTQYPEKYKFVGLYIRLDDHMKETVRRTYDLVDLIGSVGGTKAICMTIIGWFIATFGQMKYMSLIANRFYTWDVPKSFE